MKHAPLILLAFLLLVLYGCGGTTVPSTDTPIAVQPTATSAPTIAPTTAPAAATTAPTTAATPTAATAATQAPATTDTAGPAATATTTAAVVEVPTAAVPTSATLTLTPPALPAASSFAATPGPSSDQAVAVTVPVTISGKIATAGDEHWYKFDLSQYKGGLLTVDVTAASAAASEQEFRVDGANGDELAREVVAAGANKHIETRLASGAFLLRVSGGADAQNAYTAAINFHPNSDHGDAASAVPLGLAGTVTGWINTTDDAQWFAVDMSKYPQGGYLAATLSVPPQAQSQYLVRIMDASGANEVTSAPIDQGKTDTASVEADTATNYYVVVQSRGGADPVHPYTLHVDFTPHSAYSSAQAALTVTPPVLLRLRLSAPKDTAFFSFTVSGPSKVTATGAVPADGNPVRLYFFDASGQNQFANTGDINPDQQASVDMSANSAGTYVLVVRREGGEAISKNPTTVDLRITPNP